MKLYTDSLHKIAYATDASVYREIPYGVAYPETVDDVRELMQLAREKGVDLIPRAGGTSIAGQVVGSGIVVDISKHWNKILEINADERWARVQPGVVRDELNMALKPCGLFFSPETSTSNRCCIGGMFGNNSCGTHSLVYGSTRHHVIAAKGILSDGSVEVFKCIKVEELENRFGREFWKRDKHETLIERIYSQLVCWSEDDATMRIIEENYPDKELKRRSCGYAIDESITPELGLTPGPSPVGEGSVKGGAINLCKLLAGSEGTLAFVTEITVSLDPLPPKEIMVVCGHCNDLMKSFEGNLVALRHNPTAIELMDGDILELSKGNAEQAKNRFFVDGDPAALLITELRADTREELDRRADALEHDLLASGLMYKCTRVYGSDVAKVWNLRKAGLGVLSSMKGDAKPMGVIEDTAVAPRLMPAYMRDFRDMLNRLEAKCVFYGHISTGELHLRPIINLKTREGRELFRTIAYETALLVKKHRGSISGEHGDGRLRGEFIPLLYGNEAYELMRQVKLCWDPDGLFNRHKIIDTLPMDSMLRYDEEREEEEKREKREDTYFNWKAAFDECTAPGATGARSQTHALLCSIEQCNGAADCRKSNLIGGTMCPAYKVSGDELNTTRARANVIREILTRGERSYSSSLFSLVYSNFSLIKEVLDSCLACKGCRGECPSNVDMTRIRAELLQHYYDKNGTPLRTALVARLTQIEQLGRIVRPLYNFAARWKPTANVIKHIVKFAPERSIPQLSRRTMRQLVREKREDEKREERKEKKEKGKVLLYADEFTNQHEAELGLTFARLLMRLGYEVEIPDLLESGRAAISKGCLKRAKKIAEENIRRLSTLNSQLSTFRSTFGRSQGENSELSTLRSTFGRSQGENSQLSTFNSELSTLNLVGIEPSAILTFRDEYPDLVPAEMRGEALQIAKSSLLYDEFLKQEMDAGRIRASDFKADEMEIWLHGHCHQKALVGIEPTVKAFGLLRGARVHVIPSGCCGMAGSFGYEKEHYKTSLAIGEMVLFPKIREMENGKWKMENPVPCFVAAPGTSCRQQILDGTGVHAVHPIEILYNYIQ